MFRVMRIVQYVGHVMLQASALHFYYFVELYIVGSQLKMLSLNVHVTS